MHGCPLISGQQKTTGQGAITLRETPSELLSYVHNVTSGKGYCSDRSVAESCFTKLLLLIFNLPLLPWLLGFWHNKSSVINQHIRVANFSTLPS